MHPMMTGMSGQMQMHNPFDSPGAPGSEIGSLRPPTFYPPYASSPLGMNMGMPLMPPQPPHPGMGGGMMGMGAPRNTVFSNLGGMAAPPGLPTRMSTFSLATTANPLGAAPLLPNETANPGDEEVLSVLRRYLASQDLMSV